MAAQADRAIDAEQARLRTAEIDAERRRVKALLERLPSRRDPATVVGRLHSALTQDDVAAYRAAYAEFVTLASREAAARTRRELLSKLRDGAPGWADATSSRSGRHGESEPPGDPEAAWRWKRLASALDDISNDDIASMVERISDLRQKLRMVSAELIDRRAWAGQARRTSPVALQALKGYVQTIAKIGRGTGRRAGRYRIAAREQMAHAREAVPVWIAPMARVAESFVPGKSRFDVVVIDEASQLDMLGLLAWYMADQVVVVGDDQQVTPDDVGTRLAEVDSLIDTYLKEIPNRHLFDGQQSVYHLAQTAFRGTVRLREHFRCVPDIISFSSGLSYNWEILPLRPASAAPIRPHVIPYRVPGASRDEDTNDEEARHIAALVQAVCEDPAYRDKTIGVISLLGPRQAPRIDQFIRERVPLDELERRRYLCGSPPQFQGDERDIVFLSMVDSPRSGGPLPRRGDPGDRFKKRYNVAVSRGRDQVWVVHSLDPGRDLQSDDLRYRLLQWATDPSGQAAKLERQEHRTESPFEAEVLRRLVSLGYEVEAQYPAGAYRIDLVVRGGGRELAVECDGDRFHGTDAKVREDLDRQAILERMNWRFHRMRGSRFYRDPEGEMRRLVARLSELGIHPGSHP
jgi:very-short-patch-repair endonuclease